MKAILQGWNWMRILRLTLGIGLLVQGFVTKDTIAVILGLALGGMAVANIGCCGNNGCAIDTTSTNKNIRTQDEELNSKQ